MRNKNMKILIATKNQGKLNEIQDYFKSLNLLNFHNLFDSNLDFDVEETGVTYKENALIKAKAYHVNSFDFTLADDSGIEIPVISHLLGVKTRRFGAGEKATDQEWLDYFLDFFKEYKDSDRTAYFKTVVCLYDQDNPLFFEGIVKGKIAKKQLCEIKKGIPLSSVFIPEGFDIAMSQLSTSEKNNISHRAKALKKAHEYLETII
ncbi:hypothetical protein CL656_01410 [bacterium]|nr:hypothetical protein [bacterium]